MGTAADTVITWAAAGAVIIMDGTGAVAITSTGIITVTTTAGENSLPFAFAIHCPANREWQRRDRSRPKARPVLRQ